MLKGKTNYVTDASTHLLRLKLMIIRSLEEYHATRIIHLFRGQSLFFDSTEPEVDCDLDIHLEKYVVLEIALWPSFL